MDICSATAMLAISEYLGGNIYLFIYLFVPSETSRPM